MRAFNYRALLVKQEQNKELTPVPYSPGSTRAPNGCCYIFEVHQVQSFILDSQKLRDMVLASEWIERLCGTSGDNLGETWLGQALAALALPLDQVQFSRRGGGAFTAFFANEADAVRFRDFWSIALRRGALGLEFGHTLVRGGADAQTVQIAQRQLRANRARRVFPLPLPGPLAARAPRTGRAAVAQARVDGEFERHDATLSRLRSLPASGPLARKAEIWGPDGRPLAWPDYMEPGPTVPAGQPTLVGEGEARYVAVVHADGNGLGRVIAQLAATAGHEYVALFQAFSELVERVTVGAAKGAAVEVLARHADRNRVLPARFLVLAGDDMTLLVRGDLALPFTEAFLKRFEAGSREELRRFAGTFRLTGFDEALSASAGIAYIKANQPFHMAYHLCESLCGEAKRAARAARLGDERRPVPSTLAFHRVTTALIETYPALLEQELTGRSGPGDEPLRFTLGAYAAGNFTGDGSLPRLDDLRSLSALFLPDGEGAPAPLGRGAARELLRLLHHPSDEAVIHFRRWREQLKKLQPDAWDRLDHALNGLLSVRDRDLQVIGRVASGAPLATPLGDALAFAALSGEEEP